MFPDFWVNFVNPVLKIDLINFQRGYAFEEIACLERPIKNKSRDSVVPIVYSDS